MYRNEINCDGRSFDVQSIERLDRANIVSVENRDGVSVYKMSFAFADNVKSSKIKVSLKFPMREILQLYSPVTDLKRNRMVWQWFKPTKVRSGFCIGTPSLSAVSDGRNNYVTVALSDADNDNEMSFCVRDFDEKDEVDFSFVLLGGKEVQNEYEVFLRIDERSIPLYQVLKEQTQWFYGYYPKKGDYPEICEEPLYSSWYAFHQHPNDKELYDELKIASRLGFKSVIIDDGWQYDGKGTSDYIDCGDWGFSKEKFPDPKSFTDKVHALGMQVALWFPVPFVGFNTKAYKKFKDKLLYEEGLTTNAGILDVRYREVREHLVDTVKGLMSCGFDGMKLDFVDSFMMKDETPSANDQMDIKSLSEAIVKLMQELNDGIKSIKADAMIEFRQDYVGPDIVRFGNMLRVADCAFDSVTNRIGIADLRMLNYNVAVHSDMLLWSKDERKENVSKQLLNCAFGVPQISVRLTEMPSEHIDVIRAFIEYWKSNRETILHGDFVTEGIDSTYSRLEAKGKNKNIAVLYTKNDFTFDGKNTDVFNATNLEYVFMDLKENLVNVNVYDCLNGLIAQYSSRGIVKVNTPIGGRVELIKIESED